ncbi:MAG: 2-amino-4-hydroxy-6-hydroxymethyldihydropteridine diphosphokinase [Lachnospiraceae bacterium]|nr:2-amino-4-hydroxy-6-hydroxymethyldihydropteridine diphosphokinase [Lachnospiraceae bacterium]
MDRIMIRDLKVYAYHGVNPEEKAEGQNFYVDADLYLDLGPAGRSDELTATAHYGHVCKTIDREMKRQSYDLIERAAEVTARQILLEYSVVRKVRVEVKKPEAPVKLPFGMLSVEITRGWTEAVIACGSNLGDSEAILREAVKRLSEDPMIRILRTSGLIRTKAWGKTDQPDFLNGALLIETLYEPEELLDVLQKTELEGGRERKEHWGPRTLDLDLIFFGDQVIRTERLTVPHPLMQERLFVLDPLCEICPEKMHPVYRRTVWELRERLKGTAGGLRPL